MELSYELVFSILCRMDEMMRGQRGWRELSILGDKINKFSGMIEGLIWSPRSSNGINRVDDWAFEEVGLTFEG
jgi:protein phosphatase 1G